MSDDKELPPSERKLEKAREENQDEQSEEISGLMTTLVIAALAYTFAGDILRRAAVFLFLDDTGPRELDHFQAVTVAVFLRLKDNAERGALILLGATLVSGFLGNLANRRRPPSVAGLSISYDPLSKITGLFKSSTLLSTLKLWVLGLLIVGLFSFQTWRNMPVLVDAMYADPQQALAAGVQLGWGPLPLALAIVFLSALADALQKYLSFIDSNKMDEEELKKENKEDNGDPEIKAKRIEIMRGG